MDNIGLPLALIVLLIILSGYFTLMETALLESHRGRVEKLTDDKTVFDMIESPEKFITTAQVGLTLTEIIAGVITVLFTPLILAPFEFKSGFFISIIIGIVIAAFLMLLFGEFLPKRFSRQSPEKFLIKYNKSFRLVSFLMRPIVSAISSMASGIMMLFGLNVEAEETVTEDEVKDLIEQGMEDGTFEKEEQAMLDRIFQLGDQTAYSLMTPRTQIVWLDLSDSLEHNLKLISKQDNEIIPVGEGNLDDCRGVLYTKDLLNAALTQNLKTIDLIALLKKPIYVPRSMEAFRLLEKFRNTGVHEAMVLDEYGGVVGFITLNNLMQEIIGTDENTDLESTQFSVIGKDTYFVDGLYDIDDFKKKFNIDELPDEDHDHFQTMGGFLTSYFGRIPNVGDKFEWNGFIFEVARMDRARIDKIRINEVKS